MFANELKSAKRPILENKFVVLLRLWSSRLVELRFNQERIVLVLTLALFVSFCLTLNQFATAGNLISLLQSVAILGVLGVGMALVIIGRGIDLAMVTVMAISVAWMFNEINRGLSIAAAFGLGILLAALVGVANGVLVAYFEIPAIFTTLAMATLLYGLGRFLLIDSDAVFLGDQLNTFNGKVAVIQGVPTGPANQIGHMAIMDKLKGRKDITIVADQAADWDASKEHSVGATILKQHPDLCGFIGAWDESQVGLAAAVKEAGLSSKVAIVSEGSGNQAAGCDNIANGNYASYVKWDMRIQGRDLNAAIVTVLQTKPKPGAEPFALYTPMEILTKDNLHPGSCWTLDEVKQGG